MDTVLVRQLLWFVHLPPAIPMTPHALAPPCDNHDSWHADPRERSAWSFAGPSRAEEVVSVTTFNWQLMIWLPLLSVVPWISLHAAYAKPEEEGENNCILHSSGLSRMQSWYAWLRWLPGFSLWCLLRWEGNRSFLTLEKINYIARLRDFLLFFNRSWSSDDHGGRGAHDAGRGLDRALVFHLLHRWHMIRCDRMGPMWSGN